LKKIVSFMKDNKIGTTAATRWSMMKRIEPACATCSTALWQVLADMQMPQVLAGADDGTLKVDDFLTNTMLPIILGALKTAVPESMLKLARICQDAMSEKITLAELATLNPKISGIANVWKTQSEVEAVLQTRSRYTICLVQEVATFMGDEDASDDAGTAKAKKTFAKEIAEMYAVLCTLSGDIAVADSVVEDDREWTLLWAKIFEQLTTTGLALYRVIVRPFDESAARSSITQKAYMRHFVIYCARSMHMSKPYFSFPIHGTVGELLTRLILPSRGSHTHTL
jgi:hypothetical protein